MSYNKGKYFKKEVSLVVKFKDLNPSIAMVEVGFSKPILPVSSLIAPDLPHEI